MSRLPTPQELYAAVRSVLLEARYGPQLAAEFRRRRMRTSPAAPDNRRRMRGPALIPGAVSADTIVGVHEPGPDTPPGDGEGIIHPSDSHTGSEGQMHASGEVHSHHASAGEIPPVSTSIGADVDRTVDLRGNWLTLDGMLVRRLSSTYVDRFRNRFVEPNWRICIGSFTEPVLSGSGLSGSGVMLLKEPYTDCNAQLILQSGVTFSPRGLIVRGSWGQKGLSGYVLVYDDSVGTLYRYDQGAPTSLASGAAAAPGTVSIIASIRGSTISGSVGAWAFGPIEDGTYKRGQAGIYSADANGFTEFRLTPL